MIMMMMAVTVVMMTVRIVLVHGWIFQSSRWISWLHPWCLATALPQIWQVRRENTYADEYSKFVIMERLWFFHWMDADHEGYPWLCMPLSRLKCTPQGWNPSGARRKGKSPSSLWKPLQTLLIFPQQFYLDPKRVLTNGEHWTGYIGS